MRASNVPALMLSDTSSQMIWRIESEIAWRPERGIRFQSLSLKNGRTTAR